MATEWNQAKSEPQAAAVPSEMAYDLTTLN
jgi:hypothetical protein